MVEFLQKPIRNLKMNAVSECRTWICAVPRGPFDTRGTWLQRVGKVFGIHPKLASDIFYERKKRLDADTYNRMRDRLVDLQERAAMRWETLNEIATRTAELRSAAGSRNPDGNSRGTSVAGGPSDGEG